MKAAVSLSSRALRQELSYFPIKLPISDRSILVERPRCITRVVHRAPHPRKCFSTVRRWNLQQDIQTEPFEREIPPPIPSRHLPLACPGCGAPTQNVHPEDAGFFSPSRAAVRRFLFDEARETGRGDEDQIFQSSLKNLEPDVLQHLGILSSDDVDPTVHQLSSQDPALWSKTPICDRCHNLVHHQQGTPIAHPSIQAIEDTISESPHKRNHIYHVLDAADFPLSLVPGITRQLSLAHLRTQNRRSKSHKFVGGREAEMSFIITRSDLLAPQKQQVDALLPTLREILRDALGATGKDVRLGNIRCVSSKRGWWANEVREDIWGRGGAAWLVGKVNVGKSRLFEAVFPKNRQSEDVNIDRVREEARRTTLLNAAGEEIAKLQQQQTQPTPTDFKDPYLDADSLLPPAQPEVPFPVMPVISSLPGTTASPIRIPFGQGKGELIDLPGLHRNTLEPYFRPEHRQAIVMKSRMTPERIVIKPGSSLLLNGLVRITPKTPDLIVMAHVFAPLDEHLTATVKAEEYQSGKREKKEWTTQLEKGWQEKIQTAGEFRLDTDVTRKHAGPLTRKHDVGLSAARLPFVVYATDILIEGCGWVELVAQLRKGRGGNAYAGKRANHMDREVDALSGLERGVNGPSSRWPRKHVLEEAPMPEPPIVEVWSPNGAHIGQRAPINSWLNNRSLPTKGGKRPRQSMRSVKAHREKRG